MKLLVLLATLTTTTTTTAFTTGFNPSLTTTTLTQQHKFTSSNNLLQLNAEAVAADGVANGTSKKKIIVLGGDGFCGWPTSLYLSDQGHDIVVVDNLSRRNIDTELGCDSLTPIQSPDVSLICVYACVCILSFVALWGVYISVGRLYFVGGSVYYEYFYVSYVLVHTSYALHYDMNSYACVVNERERRLITRHKWWKGILHCHPLL